jgi:SAM-dependent methyltransferase
VRFVETDLHAPGLAVGGFDVVIASGVLHHTPDPARAFAAAARLARPGGILVIGLYSAYARLPHRLRRLVARATGYRIIPLDPVLRDRAAEPERRTAWLRDQYQHPEEHRHTLGEVLRWFRTAGVEYLRAYPTSTVGEEPLSGAELFTPAGDDWAFERLLVQLGWTARLWHEGGLFVVIGRAAPTSAYTVGCAGSK